MSKAKWGDRIPHVAREADGTERWVVDGKPVDLPGVALAYLFHEEQEGGVSLVMTDRVVADRAELDEVLGRGIEIHARCYCGKSTTVTTSNARLV